ncbi:MAG TPA: glycosyltransferase family 4 protein [Gemmatimonadaceae bacterium]|nr:glycosyltransferase family 4 protein [Gemmatimonadaceae bacterium]
MHSGEVGSVGGAAKATMMLCEALAKAGASVTLFVTLPPDVSVVKRLEAHGVTLRLPVVSVGWRKSVPQRSLVIQMWLEAMTRRPRFIHITGLSAEARRLLQLPRVAPIFIWETTEATPRNKFVDNRIPRFLNRVAAILSPSETIDRNIRATYGFGGRISRLPFWAEEPEKTASPPGQPPRTGTILYFGRLDSDKGFEFLLPAFSKLRMTHAGARLLICGGGDPSAICGLVPAPDGVDVVGRVSELRLDDLVRNADVVVLASLHEGYPISLLEACARSTPIVATTVGSIPEVFGDRGCALLVPPRNAEALTSALATILDEPDAVHETRRLDSRLLFDEISSADVVKRAIIAAYSLDGT